MSSLTERKAHLIVHGDQPYNAEPPLDCVSACNFDPVRRGIGVQF